MRLLHVSVVLMAFRISYAFTLDLNSSIGAIISRFLPPGLLLAPQVLQTFTQPIFYEIHTSHAVAPPSCSAVSDGPPAAQTSTGLVLMRMLSLRRVSLSTFNASYPTFGRITEIMNTLQIMGARTIRGHTLGISVGNPLSVIPELGIVNDEALTTMDWAIYQARQHGLRIFAPLVDNYVSLHFVIMIAYGVRVQDYYHGGKYTFLRWAGFNLTGSDSKNPEVMQFYTNQTIIDDFKSYIKVILAHTNAFTGLTYAEDPITFAYETGNELGGPIFGDM